MAKFTETDLRQQIKSASFSNAYLIYGEEGYLKEHYIYLLLTIADLAGSTGSIILLIPAFK